VANACACSKVIHRHAPGSQARSLLTRSVELSVPPAAVTQTVTLSGISEELPAAALLYWDSAASAWIAPPQECIPTHHASRFTFHASPITSFTAQICRSGRYGLFAPGVELFLPMVAR
jgi:hypothetical protein